MVYAFFLNVLYFYIFKATFFKSQVSTAVKYFLAAFPHFGGLKGKCYSKHSYSEKSGNLRCVEITARSFELSEMATQKIN